MKKLSIALFFVLLFLSSMAWGATDYYVDSTDAGSSDDGSFAEPWNDVTSGSNFDAKSFTTGDAVYFKVGTTSTLDEPISIDWASPTVGAWEAEGDFVMEGGETLPILDGNDYGGTPEDATWKTKHGINITAAGTSCTIQDLEIKDVWGSAINTDVEGVTVQRCYIHDIGANAFRNAYSAGGHTIEYNHVSTTNEFYHVYGTGFGGSLTSTWSAAILRTGTKGGSTVRYNLVEKSIGESIVAAGNTVEYNVISDSRSVGIYVDHGQYSHLTDTKVRHNIVIGTDDEADYRRTTLAGRTWCGPGIKVDDEDVSGTNSDTVDIIISGNLVVGSRYGFLCGSQYSEIIYNLYVFDNTFIDNAQNINVSFDNNEIVGGILVNNLSINNYDTQVDHDYAKSGTDKTDWDTIGPNWWRGGSLGFSAFFQHANDLTSDPGLPDTDPMSESKGWTTLDTYTDIEFADFYCTGVDHANAVDIVDTYAWATTGNEDHLFLTTGTVLPTQFSDVTDGTAKWVRMSQSDALAGDNWDFGGTVYQGGTPPAPVSFSLEQDLEGDSPTTNHVVVQGAGTTYVAASFTTGGAGYDLTRASPLLFKVAAGNASVTAHIYSNDAVPNPDEPDTSLGSSTAVDCSAITTGSGGVHVNFNFDTAITLAATTRYWVILTGTWNATDYIKWVMDSADTELLAIDTDTASWSSIDANCQMSFETYSGGDVIAPTITGMGIWNSGTEQCTENPTATYTTPQTVTICLICSEQLIALNTPGASSQDVDSGPAAATNATMTYNSHVQEDGGDWVLLYDLALVAGMRFTNPQLSEIAMGEATMQDGETPANDLVTTGSAGDLDGAGTIIWAVPKTANEPWEILSGGDATTLAGLIAIIGNLVPNDVIVLSSVTETTATVTESGTAGNPITFYIRSLTGDFDVDSQDYITVRGINRVSGSVLNTGGAGYIGVPYNPVIVTN